MLPRESQDMGLEIEGRRGVRGDMLALVLAVDGGVEGCVIFIWACALSAIDVVVCKGRIWETGRSLAYLRQGHNG